MHGFGYSYQGPKEKEQKYEKPFQTIQCPPFSSSQEYVEHSLEGCVVHVLCQEAFPPGKQMICQIQCTVPTITLHMNV